MELAERSYSTSGREKFMSRIGNQIINVPSGVEVAIEGTEVTVKGPKGSLSQNFHQDMTVTLDANAITTSFRNSLATPTTGSTQPLEASLP